MTEIRDNDSKEGWTWIFGSTKWHYIVNSRSLCQKWLLLGSPELVQGLDNSPDNCAECKKKLEKMRHVLCKNQKK